MAIDLALKKVFNHHQEKPSGVIARFQLKLIITTVVKMKAPTMANIEINFCK